MAECLVRAAVAIFTSLTCASPRHVSAASAEPAAADRRAFDAGFTQGQDQYDEGRFLEAARTWTEAVKSLPEAAEHRQNRESIHRYIADAYKKVIGPGTEEAIVREAHSVLDDYAIGFARAYPGEPLPPGVAEARDAFLARLPRDPPVDGEPGPEEPTSDPQRLTTPAPTARPWKPLAIGGGVATGAGAAMLVMFIAGLARARSLTARFDEPARQCDPDFPVGECREILDDGARAQAVARAGIITAPLLLGAGVAMLVIARRRKSSRQALVPALGPAMTGLSWQTRF